MGVGSVTCVEPWRVLIAGMVCPLGLRGSFRFRTNDVYGSGVRRRHACEDAVHRDVMSGPYAEGTTTGRLEETNVSTSEMTESTVDGSALLRGQEVRVHAGGQDLGTGTVDDKTEDGSIVWVVFGGAVPRRMFIEEDAARYTVLPPAAIR